MICKKCGNEVSTEVKFCTRCGEPIQVESGLRIEMKTASPTGALVATAETGLSVDAGKGGIGVQQEQVSREKVSRVAPSKPSTTWSAPTREKVNSWAVEQYFTHYEILDSDDSVPDQELNSRIAVLDKRIEQWATHPSDSQLQALGQAAQKRMLDLKNALRDRTSYREVVKKEIHTRAVEKIRRKAFESVKDDRVLQWDEWQPLVRAAADEGVSRQELEQIILALKQQGNLTGVTVSGQEARTILELKNFCNGRSHHLVEIMWNGELERWLNLACQKPELAEAASALKTQYSENKKMGAQVWLWYVGEKRLILQGPAGEEEVSNAQQWVDGVASKRLLSSSSEALEDGRLEKWFEIALERQELIDALKRAKGKGSDGLLKIAEAIKGSVQGHAAIRPFKFGKFSAQSIPELIQLCETQPDDAARLLFDGRFERWIDGVLGEAKLAEDSARVTKSNQKDQRKGLEYFIRLLCDAAEISPYPLIVAHPNLLDLGAIPMGASVSRTITLENAGRGYAWGRIALEPELPGITIPESFDSLSQVDLTLDSVQIVPGEYRGDIVIHAKGVPDACRVPLRFEVLPLTVRISPSSIDMGQVPHGKSREVSVRVDAEPVGGRMLGRAQVVAPANGVRVTKSLDGASCELKVALNTSSLEAGRRYKTSVSIDLNAGSFQVPVEFHTQLRWDIVAMWTAGVSIATGLLMLLCRYALQAFSHSIRGSDGRLSWFLTSGITSGTHPDTDVLVPCGVFAAIAISICALIVFQARKKKRLITK
jgi:hypothetical protein